MYRTEGGIQSNELMTTNVSVIPREICNIAYNGRLGRHVLCAGSFDGGKDTCQVCTLIFFDKKLY